MPPSPLSCARHERGGGVKLTHPSLFGMGGRMSDQKAHVVILGAGHAGGTAAALLRQYGHEGPITLVGEEPLPPYQRPPLSKAWLKGEANAEDLELKAPEFYPEHAIDFRPDTRGVSVNRGA